jgi:hypothetical protein
MDGASLAYNLPHDIDGIHASKASWQVALLYICALVSEPDGEIIMVTRTNKPSRASRVRSSQQTPRVSYCLYPLTSSS